MKKYNLYTEEELRYKIRKDLEKYEGYVKQYSITFSFILYPEEITIISDYKIGSQAEYIERIEQEITIISDYKMHVMKLIKALPLREMKQYTVVHHLHGVEEPKIHIEELV